MAHIQKLAVSFDGRPVGTLALENGTRIWFAYDPRWVQDGFNLSPLTMAFTATPQLARDPLFEGLHGAFNDSLPDGWGLLLMDRELKRRFDWSRHEITPMDRLAYMGARGMGSLEYAPVYEQGVLHDEVDLGALARSVDAVLEGSEEDVLSALRIQGGSPGGARPKVAIARSSASPVCLSGFHVLPSGFEHWIVKFRSKEDARDMGRAEMAYAEMARRAGILMPPTDLISVPYRKGAEDYFAVRRFDRDGNTKHHVLSLASAVYANFRMPCMDYEGVLQATSLLTKNAEELERAFRLMVFNVLAHNKDDHVKNFAFVNERSDWRLSPAFDLTFSSGMGGEHTTAISGHGNPGLEEVLKVGRRFHLKRAEEIVGEVRHAVSQWRPIAIKWRVSVKTISEIQKALAAIDQRFSTVEMRPLRAERAGGPSLRAPKG